MVLSAIAGLFGGIGGGGPKARVEIVEMGEQPTRPGLTPADYRRPGDRHLSKRRRRALALHARRVAASVEDAAYWREDATVGRAVKRLVSRPLREAILRAPNDRFDALVFDELTRDLR